jgi:hypothetical protein
LLLGSRSLLLGSSMLLGSGALGICGAPHHDGCPAPGTTSDTEDRFGLRNNLFEQRRDDGIALIREIGEKHQCQGRKYDKDFVSGLHVLPPMSFNGCFAIAQKGMNSIFLAL